MDLVAPLEHIFRDHHSFVGRDAQLVMLFTVGIILLFVDQIGIVRTLRVIVAPCDNLVTLIESERKVPIVLLRPLA